MKRNCAELPSLNQQPDLKSDGIISFGHDFDPPAGRFRLGKCSKRRNHVTAIAGRDYRHGFRAPCGTAPEKPGGSLGKVRRPNFGPRQAWGCQAFPRLRGVGRRGPRGEGLRAGESGCMRLYALPHEPLPSDGSGLFLPDIINGCYHVADAEGGHVCAS